jgi:hypothetical protein
MYNSPQTVPIVGNELPLQGTAELRRMQGSSPFLELRTVVLLQCRRLEGASTYFEYGRGLGIEPH